MIGAQGTVVDGGGRCGGWYGGGRHYLFLGLLALRHECLELLSPLHVGVDLLADRLLCPLVFVICMMSHNAARDDDASEDGERGSENRSENGAHAALRLGRPKKKKKEKKKEKKSKFCSQLGALLDALDLKHCQVQTAGAPIGAGPAIASAAKQATVTDFCNGTDFTFCGGHIQL